MFALRCIQHYGNFRSTRLICSLNLFPSLLFIFSSFIAMPSNSTTRSTASSTFSTASSSFTSSSRPTSATSATSVYSLPQPPDPFTPRKANHTNGGFVPQPSTKLSQLQESQVRTGGQGVRPLSQSTGGGEPEVESTIRRVIPTPNISRTNRRDSDVHNSQLPLTSARFSSSTTSTPSLRAPSSVSRLKPTSTPAALPRLGSSAQPSHVPFSQTPSINISQPSPSSYTPEKADALSANSFFPKIKAKISDVSRTRTKPIGAAHIVTPHKLGMYSRSNVAEEGFLSGDMISEEIEDGAGEYTDEGVDWNIAEEDPFWDKDGEKEKENIKVSVRFVSLFSFFIARKLDD